MGSMAITAGGERCGSPAGQVHKVTPEIGLHPVDGGMAKVLEKGRLAVVQGVGYPNPDRSHFRSMEIWETARLDNAPACETGWLGRALDAKAREAGRRPAGIARRRPRLPQALRRPQDRSPGGGEPRDLQASGRRRRA